ncbi:MAG: extracellular solute-binding protein [Spirochaetota bacterium]
MKVARRLLVVAVLLLVSAGFVFGNAQAEEEDDDEVAISWWALSGGGGGEDTRTTLRESIIADYEQANPDVAIALTMLENEAFKQKVQVAIQAGDPPDMFHSWGGGVMVEYAQAGQLRDITDFVESTLSQKIGIGALGVYGYEGRYYGSPYDMGGVGMWYNQAIFEEVGIDVPETWDDLLSAVEAIKDEGYVPIALGAGDRWPAHFWWTYLAMRIGGQPAFNSAYGGDGSFADSTFVQAGEYMEELAALEPFQTGYLGATYDDQAALMGNGEAAMELMGQWAPATEASNSSSGEGIGDDLGWFSFPSVEGGVGENSDVLGGGNGYVIGANAPDETLDFLDFFLSPEYNMELVDVESIVPVVAGAEEALAGNPHSQRIAQAVASAEYFQLYYDQFLPPAVGETVKDAVVALLAEQATPEEAAQMVEDSWQAEQ